MSYKKTLAVTLAAVAATMISGCASYKNPNGVPSVLDNASEANKIGYFMGVRLPDSKAPEGFDPSKETLVRDVTYSGLSHGLNHLTGGMDIGSFGFELGLSLATNLLKHEEEEYSQAMTYLPFDAYPQKDAAFDKAMRDLRSNLAKAATKAGYNVYKESEASFLGRKYLVLWVENDRAACRKAEKLSDNCYLQVSLKASDIASEPFTIAPYLNLPFDKGWKVSRLRLTHTEPETSQLDKDFPNILNELAKDLPQNTCLYVAPMKLEKSYTAPYISDGTRAYFFVKPKAK